MGSAVKDSGLDGVKLDGVSVWKQAVFSPDPIIGVGVKGPRAFKTVEYNPNGQFQKVG